MLRFANTTSRCQSQDTSTHSRFSLCPRPICFTSRCLSSFRQLSACLCISSLLFSNVAGWFHVGCVESGGACCLQNDIDTAVHAPQLSGCTHSHRHRALQQTEGHRTDCAAENESHSDSVPSQDNRQGEHDSDSCSICQSFFSLRNGSVAVETPTSNFADVSESIVQCPVDAGQGRILCDSISARGPPRA